MGKLRFRFSTTLVLSRFVDEHPLHQARTHQKQRRHRSRPVCSTITQLFCCLPSTCCFLLSLRSQESQPSCAPSESGICRHPRDFEPNTPMFTCTPIHPTAPRHVPTLLAFSHSSIVPGDNINCVGCPPPSPEHPVQRTFNAGESYRPSARPKVLTTPPSKLVQSHSFTRRTLSFRVEIQKSDYTVLPNLANLPPNLNKLNQQHLSLT